MTDFRERCRLFISEQSMNVILRQGDPVADLMAFVIAETGRAADVRLDQTLPLCLYFGNKADREGFVDVVREAYPNLIAKRLP